MVRAMKLWAVMQRIERCRYEAERLVEQSRDCSPEYRELLLAIERQWLELAAQTQALFEAIESPQPVTPVPRKAPFTARDWVEESLEQRSYL